MTYIGIWLTNVVQQKFKQNVSKQKFEELQELSSLFIEVAS